MITNISDQLVRDEGLRFHPYTDSVGKVTIGIGRNLTDVGISLAEAKLMLANDIANSQRQLNMAFPWTAALSPARYGVLLNMVFNMGIHSLGEFRNFLGAAEQGLYADAAREMLESEWAKQVGPRAQRLALQMETDQWQ